MATMETVNMEFFRGVRETSGLYLKKVVLSGAVNSDAVMLPYKSLSSLSVNLTGTGSAVVYVTNSSKIDIAAGVATWAAWDGSAAISSAITAIKIENASGDTVTEINARGDM